MLDGDDVPLDDPIVGSNMTFEEMEAQQAAVKAAEDAEKAKNAAPPDHVAGLADQVTKLTEALRVSEELRSKNALAASTQRPNEIQPEPEIKPLSDDEFDAMYRENPRKAFEELQNRSIKAAENNLSKRLYPLMQGTATSAEMMARTKYSSEFELFGDDITQAIASVKDPTVKANPAFWDDVVSFVRGKPGNFDKLVNKRLQDAGNGSSPQEMQANNVGFTATTTRGAPAGRPKGQLTPDEKRAADVLGVSYEDYAKWK